MPGPDLTQIETAARSLEGAVIRTPVLPLKSARWQGILPEAASVSVKLELFQQAGSFKGRGVLLGIRAMTPDQRAAGVVAASGGNHALAVSWAAQAVGVHARIYMPAAVDPSRIEGCRSMGAEVILTDTMAEAFAGMEADAAAGRTLMHPFEAPHMTLGAATCGAEYVAQAPDIDTFVLPVGGGGLISGMSCAIKALRPDAEVIGVEPFGADSMTRSIAAGHPVALDKVDTIADSLGAPKALPESFAVAAAHVDRMVHVSDAQMLDAMEHYRAVLRLIAEPACAASLAAICGPLRDDLAGRHVGIIACGSNISLERFTALLKMRG